MREKMSIREWQSRYSKGQFNNPARQMQIRAGWHDWFCDENELERRTHILAEPLMRLKDSSKLLLDKSFVWFMNRSTAEGGLYDDVKISDLDTGKVLYSITHNEPYDDDKPLWKVYAICEGEIGEEGSMEFSSYSFFSTDDLIEWLNDD